MDFNKQLTSLQHLDRFIRMDCVGYACDLAEKLQISESSLFLLRQDARYINAEIHCIFNFGKRVNRHSFLFQKFSKRSWDTLPHFISPAGN